MTIKVFVVDDSAVVRKVLTEILNGATGIAVMGSAQDPLFAEPRMKLDWPDVIVLDVEMPHMDGLTFLKKIMAEKPTPVAFSPILSEQKYTADAVLSMQSNMGPVLHGKLVAIGTSTGGTQALEDILPQLPLGTLPVLIVQHMPEKFTAAFAQRLDAICRIQVREAQDGDRIESGVALIAPGGRHMMLDNCGAKSVVRIKDGPPVSRHKPSVAVARGAVDREIGLSRIASEIVAYASSQKNTG